MTKALPMFELTNDTNVNGVNSVFASSRDLVSPNFLLPKEIVPNIRLKMDGRSLLEFIPEATIPVVFFDPQYRGVLDKLAYGNEGIKRGKRRCELLQMDEDTIRDFVDGINRALIPSGHLFLWIDKYHLCQDFRQWFNGTQLEVVDLITWDKGRMGMGYRTRRVSEYCVVLQKSPKRAKGVWRIHDIPDVWREKVGTKKHPHQKPTELQSRLISAVSNEGDFIVDPAAGSFSVMDSAMLRNRNFIGCDLEG
ncbi:MAG: site-specific DNA-methyltransferase [Chloroflexota bacterium]|nr:site-specific DNA-methyltransferase [Chloroflexota bacterium]MDE2950768.1 site-specific DNA-methyltransferase [Chloroflexota bacterium]